MSVLSREHRHYAHSFLALLFVVNFLNYVDRLAITGLIEPIRRDLGASDAQMGLVGLAFTLTYAGLPPLFGWLGDRWPRTIIIACSAAFWSVATAATGLARNVAQLATLRGAVGVGEASYMTNAPSLIADLFPLERRGRAMALFYTASPIGVALGVTIAGVLGEAYGWRMACFLVGLPGIATAVLVWRFNEPIRGTFDTAVDVVRPSIAVAAKALASNRTYVMLILAFTGQVFLQNAVEFWLPTILQRDKGFPLLAANASYGAVALPAGIIAPLLGSFLGDALRRRTASGYYWVCAGSVILTAVPLVGLGMAFDRAPVFTAVFFEILLANASLGLVVALAVSIVSPGIRATATAVMLTTVHLLGDAISQPLVGKLSTDMQVGKIPEAVVRGLAEIFRTAPDDHLTIALLCVALPAALVSATLYVVAGRVSSA